MRSSAAQRDPTVLAEIRDMRCKASIETVRAALVGNYRPEHVFALTQALELYDFYQASVAECDAEIEAALAELNAEQEPPGCAHAQGAAQTMQPNARELRVRGRAVPAYWVLT